MDAHVVRKGRGKSARKQARRQARLASAPAAAAAAGGAKGGAGEGKFRSPAPEVPLAPIFAPGKRVVRLLLIRHAETQGYGIRNTPISHWGVQQSLTLAGTLQEYEVDLLVVSPLMRALQTACLALSGRSDAATPSTSAALQQQAAAEAAAAGAAGGDAAAGAEAPVATASAHGVPLAACRATGEVPGELHSFVRAQGAFGAAKEFSRRDALRKLVAAGHLTPEAAQEQGAHPLPDASDGAPVVPVVVSPLVREALNCVGDAGEDGATVSERLSGALADSTRTEVRAGGRGRAVEATSPGYVRPADAAPWSDDALHTQLATLPEHWWLSHAGKADIAAKLDPATGRPRQHITENSASCRKRAGAFRKSLARLPRHVRTVAVVAHSHWLKSFLGVRKGWAFTQLKVEHVEV